MSTTAFTDFDLHGCPKPWRVAPSTPLSFDLKWWGGRDGHMNHMDEWEPSHTPSWTYKSHRVPGLTLRVFRIPSAARRPRMTLSYAPAGRTVWEHTEICDGILSACRKAEGIVERELPAAWAKAWEGDKFALWKFDREEGTWVHIADSLLSAWSIVSIHDSGFYAETRPGKDPWYMEVFYQGMSGGIDDATIPRLPGDGRPPFEDSWHRKQNRR